MIKFLQTGGKTQKIVLGAILVFISALMVISLVPGGLMSDSSGASGRGTLARIDDQAISSLEVQQMARNMARQQFRGNIPEQIMPYLMQRAADQLITQKTLRAEARRVGLRVTDEELRNTLKTEYGEYFFPGGNYVGDEQYENVVQSMTGVGVREFEDGLRSQLLIRKLIAMVAGGVAVTDSDLQKEFQRSGTKVKVDYAVLTMADLEKQIKPTDAELHAFYDKNKSRYTNAIPEKRRASYVVIDNQKVLVQVKSQITADDMQRYYNQNKDRYRVPEQAKVRHILIRTPLPGADGKVDQKAADAAQAKAQDILKQVKSGGNFAEIAKKNSDDPGSAKAGGELVWIQRGRTVPEFEKVAFALPAGQTSDLVKSSCGFHIIQVEEKQEAHVKPFNEVKDEIAQQLAQDKAAAAADALAAKVQNEARTRGIDKAAGDNHLQVYHSELFTQTDTLPGIGSAPEFAQTAFSAQVNGPPQSVRVPQGYAVLVVTEDQKAQTPSFEQWRAKVEQDFKQERASQMLPQKTQELADRAHAAHDLKKAAKELGASVKTSDLVTMDSQVPDLGSMSGPASVAFDMKPGEISNAIENGGSGVVFAVVDKQQPSAAELAKTKEQVRERLLQQKREQRLQMFVTDVRDRMQKDGKIRVNKDEWNRLTGGQNIPLAS